MKPQIKPIIDESKLGINPLTINDLEIKAINMTFTNSFKHQEGDIIHNTALIESEKNSKVFIKSSNREFVSALNAPAKSLFLWIIFELEYNTDYIWINKTRYMKENYITSINTYKKAIDELTRYCVIYPMLGKKNVYWINPRLFFNGNRITKYPNNITIINT